MYRWIYRWKKDREIVSYYTEKDTEIERKKGHRDLRVSLRNFDLERERERERERVKERIR